MFSHSFRNRILVGASALAFVFAGAAQAQTFEAATEVDEVVVTAPNYVPQGSIAANKTDIPLVETPASVTVITRDQIDLLDWNTLSQTVRYTAGVTGENYGPDERVDWLTQRGFNPVQYIDGVQASIGSITNTGLDLYGAQSVEILKGPASALYGQTPPGGIVNITSRRPERDFAGEVEAQVGSWDHVQGNFDVTGSVTDNVSARLTGLWRDRGTQTRGVDSERAFIAPAATIDLTPDTRITFLSFYQDDALTGDGLGFLPAYGTLLPNPNGRIPTTANLGETGYNRFERQHWGVGYDFSHDFSDTLRLQQNLKYTSLESDQRGIGGNGFVDADFDGVPDDYRTVSRYSFSFAEDVDTFAVDTRLAGELTAGGLEHRFVAGLDYRRYDYLGASAFGFGGIPTIDVFAPVYGYSIPDLPPVPFSNQLQTQTGLYVSDQITSGGFILTLGARHDWVETEDQFPGGATVEDDDTSYRVGLSYLFDNGVAPYVSFSRSFQPTAGTDRNGNAFEPTTGEQVEAGVKWDARNLPDDKRLFVTAAAYQLTQQNVLTADPQNLPAESFQVQTGEVEVKGVELEVVGRFNERLSFNAAYTWTDSEVTRSNGPDLGNELPVTPEHKVSALVDYTMQQGTFAGLGASLGFRYLGESTGNLAASYQPLVFINPSVTLWDGSIHYDRDDWRLSLTASNLLDEEYVARCYSYANCFYGTRRMVTASVTRRF